MTEEEFSGIIKKVEETLEVLNNETGFSDYSYKIRKPLNVFGFSLSNNSKTEKKKCHEKKFLRHILHAADGISVFAC